MKVKEYIAKLNSFNMDAEVVFEDGTKEPRFQPLEQANGTGSEKRLRIKLVDIKKEDT